MITIQLATRNPGKVKEIERLLGDLPVSLLRIEEGDVIPNVVEDGATFAANARKKALEIARATGHLTLADDSGLEVDALGGRPGIWSARFGQMLAEQTSLGARPPWLPDSPPDAQRLMDRDDLNNLALMHELQKTPAAERTARFRCVVVLARPGRVLAEASGIVDGMILDRPRGNRGFGYDSLFLVPELGCSFAELPAMEKDARSHRGRALHALRPKLLALL